ncbi:MAG: hypothetical protein R3C53_09025 [Pirellulaceae bacterium]
MPTKLHCRYIFIVFALVCSESTVNAQFRKIVTIAGDGQTGELRQQGRAQEISVTNPFGMAVEADGDVIIAAYDQHVLYRLDSTYSKLQVVAGSGKKGMTGKDGDYATSVEMNMPHEVQVDRLGNIYVADTMNHRVGMIEASTGRWKNIAGNGQAGYAGDGGLAAEATLNQAYSIALEGEQLFVADLKNHRIRKVDLRSGKIVTICGTGENKMPTDGGLAIEQSLAGPRSLAVDKDNLWIVLREGNSVWRLDRADDRLYHVAGSGVKGFSGDGQDAKLATFNGPKGIAVETGHCIYIADTENHAIRRVAFDSGKISTVVGSPTGEAGFSGDGDQLHKRLLRRPHGVLLLDSGELLIGDSENHRVRMLVP